jgi:hypothetical protein
VYCYSNYYGPIKGDRGFYYLSVLNPALFELPGHEFLDEMRRGYAFGVFKRKSLPKITAATEQFKN